MKIKFLYIENGKIILTKQELEALLEESYQDGVAEGRKVGLTYTPNTEKIATPSYETQPHWIYTPDYVFCDGSSAAKVTANGDLKWVNDGTISIASCCNDNSTFSTAVADATIAALTQHQTDETPLEG